MKFKSLLSTMKYVMETQPSTLQILLSRWNVPLRFRWFQWQAPWFPFSWRNDLSFDENFRWRFRWHPYSITPSSSFIAPSLLSFPSSSSPHSTLLITSSSFAPSSSSFAPSSPASPPPTLPLRLHTIPLHLITWLLRFQSRDQRKIVTCSFVEYHR